MFAPLSSSTIAAPSTINFINYSGYFPCSPLAASLVSDHIPWKCAIWKHEDYHINIHSILTSNVFLVISIHIQSCGSDFWKYLLLFSPSNSPKLTGLSKFAQSAHILLHESTLLLKFNSNKRINCFKTIITFKQLKGFNFIKYVDT